jgi:hypothetical protein
MSFFYTEPMTHKTMRNCFNVTVHLVLSVRACISAIFDYFCLYVPRFSEFKLWKGHFVRPIHSMEDVYSPW